MTMTKTLTILSAALALALPAYADDAHHPETQKDKPAAAAKTLAKTPKGQQSAGDGMDCPMHKGGMGMMGAEHEAMMSRMQQMEMRMDMMQMMMEQMMKSQAASAK